MEEKKTAAEPQDNPSTPNNRSPYEALEQMGTWLDGFRAWILRSWRLGVLMSKGAYIVGERKRLFQKLGESVYYKISKGEIANIDLEPIVQQLDRLTKKVEIEEILIRSIRFGTRNSRSNKETPEEKAGETKDE